MFYDPQVLLNIIDAKWMFVIAGGGIAMILNYIFFYAAARNAIRDQSPAFPLIVCTTWFAHDLSFVLKFSEWFSVYDHWYLKLFWLALIPTTLFEVYYIRQTWRFGRSELHPNSSQDGWTAYVLGAVVLACVAWWGTKMVLDDPLYAWSFGAIGAFGPFYALARAVRRGDTAGQSVLMWGSYAAMTATWFTCTIVVFGGMFRHPVYIAVGAVSVICSLLLVQMCRAGSARSAAQAVAA